MNTMALIALTTTVGLCLGFGLARIRGAGRRQRTEEVDAQMQQREASLLQELSARDTQIAKLRQDIDAQREGAVGKINEAFHASRNLANEITEDLGQISALMRENLQPAQSICEMGNSTRDILTHGRATLEGLSSSLTRLAELSKLIANLSLHMERVNERSRVIHNIANQANLLSLNAAIEAEHAGDAGRGFSVVANDMGRLSDLSAGAALEISNILGQSIDDVAAITAEIENRVTTFMAVSGDVAKTFADTEHEIGLIANVSSTLGDDSARTMDKFKQITESTETKMETLTKVLSDVTGMISGNPVTPR